MSWQGIQPVETEPNLLCALLEFRNSCYLIFTFMPSKAMKGLLAEQVTSN